MMQHSAHTIHYRKHFQPAVVLLKSANLPLLVDFADALAAFLRLTTQL